LKREKEKKNSHRRKGGATVESFAGKGASRKKRREAPEEKKKGGGDSIDIRLPEGKKNRCPAGGRKGEVHRHGRKRGARTSPKEEKTRKPMDKAGGQRGKKSMGW